MFGQQMHDRIHKDITERLEDGKLPCKHAFALVQALGVEPMQVGRVANTANIRISRCQLGLFGFGPKAAGKHKIVHPAENVPERLAARLRSGATQDGITCAAIWEAADGLGYSRLEASAVVEAMGLKVSHCQLGCFPRPKEG
jgi:hypothetical protein